MKNTILTLLMLFCISHLHAQGRSNMVFPNNQIYVSGGVGGGGINYSVKLKEKTKKYFSARYLRIVVGAGSLGVGSAYIGGVVYEWVFGKENHHFETGLGAGVGYITGHNEFWPIPFASCGYRFQKPGGWFFIRTGIGLPELPYLGFGIAF